jgi:hypothetical protein
MSFHYSNIVTEPFGYLENAHARAGQQAGKGVPHDMGRHPGATLLDHVFIKGVSEIPAIDVSLSFGPGGNMGVKHVCLRIVGHAVVNQKVSESSRERDGAFFPVLEAYPFVLAQVKVPGFKIKPESSRLHDLVEAESRVESTVEDEGQVLPGSLLEQAVPQVGSAEVLPRRRCGGADARFGLPAGKRKHGVRSAQALILGPMKKTLDRHEVPESGGLGDFGAALGVPALEMLGADLPSCNLRAHFFCPLNNEISLAPFSGQRPVTRLHAAFDIPPYCMNQQIPAFKNRVVPQVMRPADCLGKIFCLEGHGVALAGDHPTEPIIPTIFIDAAEFGRFLHGRNYSKISIANANFTRAHMDSYGVETKMPVSPKRRVSGQLTSMAKARRSSIYEAPQKSHPLPNGSGAYGTRTRNLCRDRAAL